MMAKYGHTAALQAFLNRMIDYAGLYPPASLSLEDAIRNFVRYQDDPESWMLARFIIPASRLAELSQLADEVFPEEGLLSFSALGRSGNDRGEFFENFDLDLLEINNFRNLHVSQVLVGMFEAVIPESELLDQLTSDDLITEITDILLVEGLIPFFEAPFGEDWELRAQILINSLRGLEDAGFKLRTGGIEARMFPSPQQVAWAIATARDAGVPMKATAGLHHPMRHYNESVKTKMHGFINVFGAGILASVYGLGVQEIQSILEDEDPANFKFDETGFAWKDVRADNEQIRRARENRFLSFGSCSFDEPREDLRGLGLM
jgi:hypothetical protein